MPPGTLLAHLAAGVLRSRRGAHGRVHRRCCPPHLRLPPPHRASAPSPSPLSRISRRARSRARPPPAPPTSSSASSFAPRLFPLSITSLVHLAAGALRSRRGAHGRVHRRRRPQRLRPPPPHRALPAVPLRSPHVTHARIVLRPTPPPPLPPANPSPSLPPAGSGESLPSPPAPARAPSSSLPPL
uniref:Uncharacterized protein n=1 Tax=Arundo donax TaxID=35708 RepID=A0A0A8ZT02_ARUDO